MRAIIVGCGRVGAGLAEALARSGHDVTIIDITSDAFGRLEPDFAGNAVRGDGTDEDVLRRAGAESADWFFGMTEGDNRNVLTAQLAAESLGIANVVAKVNDPVRSEAYRALGISTVCRTTMMVDALVQFTGLPHDPSVAGVSAATGQHPGGDHHRTNATDEEPTTTHGVDAAGSSADAARSSADAPRPASEPTTGPGADTALTSSVTSAHATPKEAPNGTNLTDSLGDFTGRARRPWKLRRRSDERGSEG